MLDFPFNCSAFWLRLFENLKILLPFLNNVKGLDAAEFQTSISSLSTIPDEYLVYKVIFSISQPPQSADITSRIDRTSRTRQVVFSASKPYSYLAFA